MNFLHTSFPDDPDDDKDAGLSDDALAELGDDFDDEDDPFAVDEDDDELDADDPYDDVDLI